MNKKKFKDEMVSLIDIMINNADKGPSGFWTDDYEGCGNPKIFPEFDEGLKHGRLIQKDHYLCPWNTAILYGNGYGNITTGCYHSCSIKDAKYLSAKMLRTVLLRFKKKMQSGQYDNVDCIAPLLTAEECAYIEKKKIFERKLLEQKRKSEEAEIRIKIEPLLKKYYDEDIQEFIVCNYGKNIIAMTENGAVDFSPKQIGEIVGGEKLTYNDYIDIQIQSFGKQRQWFKTCYYNIPLKFKGQIEKIAKDTVCFNRIFVSGMYPDGEMFDGKEDHVWMDLSGFETFQTGDRLTFTAEVYCYLKKGNGKQFDFSLRNPKDIKKIETYELPSDNDLFKQNIDQIICEACYLSEYCYGNCLLPKGKRAAMRQEMSELIKSTDPHSEKNGGQI